LQTGPLAFGTHRRNKAHRAPAIPKTSHSKRTSLDSSVFALGSGHQRTRDPGKQPSSKPLVGHRWCNGRFALEAISKPCTTGWFCRSCFWWEADHAGEQRQGEGGWRHTVGCWPTPSGPRSSPCSRNDPSARAGGVSLLKIQSAFESFKLSAAVC